MFRNILDSTEVSIQPDVTCLVGKNESGKTALLHALWRLNPARLNPKFSVPEHYPAWLEKRHRNEGKVLEDVHPVEAEFEWEPADRELVEKIFGSGVVPESGTLRLWKSYNNKLGWQHNCKEATAVIRLLDGIKIPRETRKMLKSAATFMDLRQVVRFKVGEPRFERQPFGGRNPVDGLDHLVVVRVALGVEPDRIEEHPDNDSPP